MLGRSLSVSQAVGRAASLAYSAPLQGKPSAWFIPGRYSSTPCAFSTSVRSPPNVRYRSRCAAVRTRLQSHKVFRAAGMRSFGPLAQTVSVITALFSGIRLRPELALPATDCAVRPHQRCRQVLLFEGQCPFAKTVVPRINVFPRSLP